MSWYETLACLALVFGAAFMSASEVALFSLSRFQLRHLREQFRSSHRKIKRLLADPGGLLISILVVNELFSVSLSTLMADFVSRQWGAPSHFAHSRVLSALANLVPPWALQTLLGTLITSPILLFLCEVTPKGVGARANQIVAPLTAGPLTWIYNFLKPVRFVLKKVVALVARLVGEDASAFEHEKEKKLREEDFLVMVEEGHKEGAIHQSELDLIRNVFELDDTTVEEVLTPISQVYGLSATTTLKGALSSMLAQRFSRIPVIGASRRQIVGVLYSKDLLRAKLEPETAASSVATVMHKPMVVAPSMRLNTLFRKFKQSKNHMAVVEKAPGEALGIVTMDDVLDALFVHLFSGKRARG